MQYPMNVELEGRRCVVLGGGPVALRKVRSLLTAEAEVLVVSPVVVPELEQLSRQRDIVWQRQRYLPECLADAFLVICATDDAAVNAQVAGDAKAQGIWVNAPAQPELSDFTVPAMLRRGKLLVTVSTGNLSPAYARALRRKLEQQFPDSFGLWLERLHSLRDEMKEKLPSSRERENFWRYALDEDILEWVRTGELDRAEVEIRNAIDRYRAEP